MYSLRIMKSENKLILTCVLAGILIKSAEAFPSDEHPPHQLSTQQDKDANAFSLANKDEGNGTESSRWGHARMKDLGTTTLGYDEWWFLTTPHRPFVSYRDYPGKPGVATWKELSPGEPSDKRQSRKVAVPTAEGVSSRANRTVISQEFQFILLIMAAMLLRHSRWTIISS